MRNITLALLVTISFAFKAGDAEVEVALLDICSLEAAHEAAQVQEKEAAIRLKRYARAAKRAKAKAEAAVARKESESKAAEAKKQEEAEAAELEKQETAKARKMAKAAASKAPRKAGSRRVGSGASSSTVDSLIRLATSLEGIRYVSGGNSADRGFDCSGFVNYVFRAFGLSVGRSSRDQALMGEAVSRDEARPGDIVVFSRGGRGSIFHAGLITEANDKNLIMVHANQRGGVHSLDISQDNYWAPKLHSIRRVL